MTVGILDGIVSRLVHHHLYINNLNYWKMWTMFRLRDFSSVLIVIVIMTKISPLGSITPVSLHDRTISYVYYRLHCMRGEVPCVPNSISPLIHWACKGYVVTTGTLELPDSAYLFTTNRGLHESSPLANWQIVRAPFVLHTEFCIHVESFNHLDLVCKMVDLILIVLASLCLLQKHIGRPRRGEAKFTLMVLGKFIERGWRWSVADR